MLTFLAGGTGTPKLLAGATDRFSPSELAVVANTGDDIELGGLLVCPDVDTVIFQAAGELDTARWWGIENDSHETNRELHRLADAAGLDDGPQYLPPDQQTSGREIARWRRFSGIAEFMTIGDRDRAVHITRTSLLDAGHSLTEATAVLTEAFDVELTVLPMSDEPVATLVETPDGTMHFEEYWVAHRGDVSVEAIEYRGSDRAGPTAEVSEALTDPVIIGPSNPVTSIGPILSLPGVRSALESTPVVAVSPFIEDELFSGPAADLMAATGMEPTTQGVADAYPFADAFVLDSEDATELDRPTVRTDITIDTEGDSRRVIDASWEALQNV